MPIKLKPGTAETVLAIPAAEINAVVNVLSPVAGATPLASVTAAILNEYVSVTQLGAAGAASAGGNITCVISDDMTLGLEGAETDDSRTLCTVGDSVSIKRLNFTAQITYPRDADNTAANDFNLARALFRAPDVPYVLVHRVGYPSTTSFAPGQKVSYYYVWTDFPVPGLEDDDYITETQNFIPKGLSIWEGAL